MNNSKPIPGAYQKSGCMLTLREGLEEYYAINPGFKGTGHFLGQPRQTVVDHDVCHVVFGLGTTSREELLVEVVTLFGSIVGLRKTSEIVRGGFFRELLRTFGVWRLGKRFILTIPAMLSIFVMTRRMTKKWPHFDYDQYMDIPLNAIRHEFSIRISGE